MDKTDLYKLAEFLCKRDLEEKQEWRKRHPTTRHRRKLKNRCPKSLVQEWIKL